MWQERWTHETTGRSTHNLIPNIREWIERSHGNVGYYMTQFLTNHGSFNQYLCRFNLRSNAICESCGALEETADHIIFECPKWINARRALNSNLGETIAAENIIKIMLKSENDWNRCENYINTVIKERCSIPPNLPR